MTLVNNNTQPHTFLYTNQIQHCYNPNLILMPVNPARVKVDMQLTRSPLHNIAHDRNSRFMETKQTTINSECRRATKTMTAASTSQELKLAIGHSARDYCETPLKG